MRSCFFFFFKQKTAYEMRISDWSSDVCSSDLASQGHQLLLCRQARPGPDETHVAHKDVHQLRELIQFRAPQLVTERGDGAGGHFMGGSRRRSDIHRAQLEIGRASCRERVCQYV